MSQDRKQPCVFVVDDEPTISSTLSLILNKEGFASKSFNAPLEALQAARFFVPDLLITDIAMPGMSGVQLAIAFQQAYPASRILLFSGHAHAVGDIGEAAAAGFSFDFLRKPVHPNELLRKVRELLNRKSAPDLDRYKNVDVLPRTRQSEDNLLD
jgi:DNA-binding response OmpR family regulator